MAVQGAAALSESEHAGVFRLGPLNKEPSPTPCRVPEAPVPWGPGLQHWKGLVSGEDQVLLRRLRASSLGLTPGAPGLLGAPFKF